MKNRVTRSPEIGGNPEWFSKIKYFLITLLLLICALSFAENIQINQFFYDSDLIGFEPIFTQKVKVNSVNQDASGQVFLHIADGSRVKFIGLDMLYPDEAIRFLHENMAGNLVYLSYEGKEEDEQGFKKAYIWSDEIYEYYSVSVLWNAVLIINGYALPLDYDYTYKEIFLALQSNELEIIKTEVEDIKTTRDLQQKTLNEIPAGFEIVSWEMKKPEVWYRMNKQLIEERDYKLVYISDLYGESCLLTFFFNEDATIKSVAYIFSFVNVADAEKTYKKFMKNMNQLFGEESIVESKDFQKTDQNTIDAYCLWKGSNATAELLIQTISRNVHGMRLFFERTDG
ncbi:MAG TPA: hypothetical protein P5107_04425 [Thermotogota bacterium]|nr:hypothetical protein [Thermotogota bacterium]HRW34287.1 hypothetical protein [Thermotogota bacterium]